MAQKEIQYLYIGKYYHIKNKKLPLDYKVGVTNCLDNREFQLSDTRSPIKYIIIHAWEVPRGFKREDAERLIAVYFPEYKYSGCEWYHITDINKFIERVNTILTNIADIILVNGENFIKVDLTKIKRTKKRYNGKYMKLKKQLEKTDNN